MLVLSRRRDETIRIGDNIVIKVISCGPAVVGIGVDAPPELKVRRGEVYQRIQSEIKQGKGDSHADGLGRVDSFVRRRAAEPDPS